MKVLRLLEKIAFILAVVLAFVSLAFSYVFDESVGIPGMLTSMTVTFTVGIGFCCVFLGVGAFLYFVKNDIARKVSTGLVVASFALLFGSALANMASGAGSLSAILALVASVLYLVSLMFRLIRWIVVVAKPEAEKEAKAE